MNNNKTHDYLHKILLIGDYGVGKTSILNRFFDNKFSYDLSSTIGVDVFFENIEIDDKIVKLQCWDTSGQERFRDIVKCYYKGLDGVVIVFDINNIESFYSVKLWYNDFQKYKKESKVVPIILVGSKSDLKRNVKYEEAKELSDILNIEYVEVSSTNNHNIESIFSLISKQIRLNKKKYEDKINNDNNNSRNNCLACSSYKNTSCTIF